ncbi:MAG: c-type cytochrome domain-containing protein [Cyclobacteriaceae bacterium]
MSKLKHPGLVVSIVLVATLMALIWSCSHDPFLLPDPPIVVNPENDFGGTLPDCQYQGVCFESSILPIFVSSCAKPGCHDAVTREEGFNLTSYANIIKKGIVPGNANESKLYKVTTKSGEDQMPPYPDLPLTQPQRDSIAKWINGGAKNTVKCNCACDSTAYTYQATIAPLLQGYCVGCHTVSSLGGNINLSNYAGVKASIDNGRLMGSIKHESGFSPMPKGSKLSDCQITQISKWVSEGALNN